MRDLLDRLDRWRADHRAELIERLAPGVEIPASEGELPDDVRAWFLWHDGLREGARDADLVLGWRSLGWVEARDAADRAARDPLALMGDWHPSWLPFAASDDGGLLVIDVDAARGEPGAVVEVMRDASICVVHAPSLSVWLAALVETLEEGLWAPDASGMWAPTPENEDLWSSLVLDPPGYPHRIDGRWEHVRLAPRPPGWREAYAHALGASAVEALWLGLPRGDVALGLRLGDELDRCLARIEAAPSTRRAGELGPLASALRASSHPRAGEVERQWLACATPFDALVDLPTLDLSDPARRDALVARTAAWSRARTPGSVAWSIALESALASIDDVAAVAVGHWHGRLRSGRMAVEAEALIVARARATTAPDAAAALVDGVMADVHLGSSDEDLDAFLVDAAVRAALATGRGDALLAGWTRARDRRCFAAMTSLVREGDLARAAAMPGSVECSWLGDALALHLANLTAIDPDPRALRALDASTDHEFEGVYDASVHGAVCEVRVRHHLRRGDVDAARSVRARHHGALQRAIADALDAARATAAGATPGERPAEAEAALAALHPWAALTPNPYAFSGLRRLLRRVLATDPTAALALDEPLRDAARRVAESV